MASSLRQVEELANRVNYLSVQRTQELRTELLSRVVVLELEGGGGGGSLTDGDKGDVSVADGQITVNPGAITITKLANLAQGTFIGRATAGTGVPEAITIGPGLELAGATLRRSAITGPVSIAAGTTVSAIGVGAVALDRIAPVASDRLWGRDEAGVGPATEIGVGGNLEFDGANAIRRGALVGEVTASAGSGITTITPGAVGLAKHAPIASGKFLGRLTAGTGAVELVGVSGGLESDGAGNVRRGALTGEVTAPAGSGVTTIATGAVGTTKLADGSVTTVKLLDGSVTGVKIQDLTIGGGKLANGAVGNPKLAPMAAQTLKGNITGSSAEPADVPISELQAFFGGASESGAALSAIMPTEVLVTAGAVGVGSTAARGDHKHPISTNSAVANPPGSASSAGVSVSLARADHTHALAAFGTTAGTFAQGNDSRFTPAPMAAMSIKGNNSAVTAPGGDLNGTGVTAMLNPYTATLKGLVPAPGASLDDDAVLTKTGWRVLGAPIEPQLKISLAAYINPASTDGIQYFNAIEEKLAENPEHFGYVILNPNSGPGYGTDYESGGAQHTAYANQIAAIVAAGGRPGGYVSTNYRDSSDYQDDVYYWGGPLSVMFRYTVDPSTNLFTCRQDDGTTVRNHNFPVGFSTALGIKSWVAGYEGHRPTMNPQPPDRPPAGLAIRTSYYFIWVSASTFRLATSLVNASNNVAIDVTDAGIGGQYMGIRRGDVEAIKGEMLTWFTRHPSLRCFFLDEMEPGTNTSAEPGGGTYRSNSVAYYGAIQTYAKTLHPDMKVVHNPGGTFDESMIGTGDTFMRFENDTLAEYLAYTPPAWMANYPRDKYWDALHHVGNVSETQVADRARAIGAGHLSLNFAGYSTLPSTTGTDSADWKAMVDYVVAENGNVVDEGAAVPAFGDLTLTDPSTHAIGTPGTYIKLNAGSSSTVLSKFTASTLQRLTFVGDATKTFRVSFDVNFVKASGSLADVTMRLARNALTFSNRKITCTVGATDASFQRLSLSMLMTLDPGQYVEIWATSSTADALTIKAGSLTVTEV